jgi:hypothetical protein
LAEPIIGVFIAGDGSAAVVAIGGDYLSIVGASYVFLGVFYVVQGGFRGSGSTRLAMVFAFVGFIVFRSIFAYLLAVPAGLGATGIWYGEAAANVLRVTIAGLYFLRGTWVGRWSMRATTASQTSGTTPSIPHLTRATTRRLRTGVEMICDEPVREPVSVGVSEIYRPRWYDMECYHA